MKIIFSVFAGSITFSSVILAFLMIYSAGYKIGYDNSQTEIIDLLTLQKNSAATIEKGETVIVYVTPKPAPVAKTYPKWGGPELWEVVNKRRVEFGVNPMSIREELCTIASIRLNQLLELGKLDGHEGFGKLPEERADVKWIFEKYTLSEFLVSGAKNPTDAVSLWENTLGHKKLLSGGEYSWGCIYAQSGFGVAIAAY
ncbi:MAG: hypothetical protein Q8Q30_00350 [Candidatus Woesebacteria bacterium]|nr:hypothetical protein [Candidatus Woesebacteria bacterium]